MVARLLFQLRTLLFMALGVAHVTLMARDRARPRHLVPVDDHVQEVMNRTALRLSHQTTMWKAWLDFNLSHGLGLPPWSRGPVRHRVRQIMRSTIAPS